MIGRANDIGLLTEGLSTSDPRQLGNFPHVFSYLWLVNAAHRLSSFRSGERQHVTR